MGPERREDYFLDREIDALELAGAPPERTEQSRVISAQFEKILDALPFYVLLVDTNHTIQFANRTFRQVYDVTLEELEGKYCPKFVHGVSHDFPGCPVEDAIRGGPTEKEFFAEDHGKWLLTTAYPTGAKTRQGLDLYFHTTRDITAQKEAQAALEASEARYRRLFDELEDAVFAMAPDGRLQDLNPAGLELLQIRSREEMSRLNLFDDLSVIDSDWAPFIEALKLRGRVIDHEVSFRRPDGTIVIVSINASMEHGDPVEGGVIRGIMRDLTRNRELEQRSIVDEMTSMYNHAFFQSYLLTQVRHIRAGQSAELSMLFADIDDFKAYNDAFGHQEGDYVLRKVAKAMRTALRGEDVAARYGGEEFAIVLGCRYDTALELAERVRTTVEDLCSSFADARIRRSVTVSIGVASLKRDADTAEQLVTTADQRMYLAKKRGKNQVCGDSAPAQTHGPNGRRKPRED